MNDDTEYAKVVWHPEDIMDLRDEMTHDQAIMFLERNSKHLQDVMIERGWEAIMTFLVMDETEK